MLYKTRSLFLIAHWDWEYQKKLLADLVSGKSFMPGYHYNLFHTLCMLEWVKGISGFCLVSRNHIHHLQIAWDNNYLRKVVISKYQHMTAKVLNINIEWHSLQEMHCHIYIAQQIILYVKLIHFLPWYLYTFSGSILFNAINLYMFFTTKFIFLNKGK